MNLKASIALALLGTAGAANAFVWTFNDVLTGLEEVPPNGSPATGIASGTYDDVTNMLMMDVNATGFTGTLTAGHIHGPAPVGTNAPVIIPLTNVAGGTTWESHTMVNITAAQEAQLLANQWYVNLHTSTFPGGEIRGQLNPVPEPASLAALLVGASVLGLRRRR